MVKLENWYIVKELNKVIGNVYGHDGIKDGEEIITSQIRFIDPEETYVTTNNSVYKLGKKKGRNTISWKNW